MKMKQKHISYFVNTSTCLKTVPPDNWRAALPLFMQFYGLKNQIEFQTLIPWFLVLSHVFINDMGSFNYLKIIYP